MPTSRILAPEFEAGLEWFNTRQAVTLAQCRGKVVLFVFSTYSSIACMHVEADLQYLEEKYPYDLAVIGIHTAKYPHLADSRSLQQAINRLQVSHPVIKDADGALQQRFGISVWPSIVVIDPEGYILGVIKGEGRRKQLDGLIRQQLLLAEKKQLRRPAATKKHLHPEPESTLAFPGRVLATRHRLFISDSGHHRVLECTHDGSILRQYGSPSAGFLDGNGDEACFNNPQGMALVNDCLYVADTNNHAIRRIQLRSGDVDTLSGNGSIGALSNQVYADPQVAQLNSPWGLGYFEGSLYIAMAGCHQLWRWQLGMNQLGSFAGTGQEGLADGLPEQSLFAQPTGVAPGPNGLYVSDAESSALRMISLPDGRVTTLVGKGLFDFGDHDGPSMRARLQHPLDLAFDARRNLLWICDCYNDKLKYLQVYNNEVGSLELQGLREPGGICVLGDMLWVANTNRHQVWRLDLVHGTSTVVPVREQNQVHALNTGYLHAS